MFRLILTHDAEEEGNANNREVLAFIDLISRCCVGPIDFSADSSRILAVALNAVRANMNNAIHLRKIISNLLCSKCICWQHQSSGYKICSTSP